jgi:D-alanyl-lipoteichoic acid acyltransferase DltB (MBOAT superfamily)
MFTSIDFNKLINLFKYDQTDPLLFNSSMFLFLFLGLLLLYQLLSKSKRGRVYLLIAFSMFFYYKSSGFYFLLLVLSALFNFYMGKLVFVSQSTLRKRLILFSSIIFNIGLLAYFKYTNFFIQIINSFGSAKLNPLDIFLPIGISFFTFKALSYVLDLYLEKMEPEKNFSNFLLYISFFPNILAGPIDRASRFLPQLSAPIMIDDAFVGKGIILIISGLFKKAIIADYISTNFVDRIFDLPTRFTGVENLLGVYAYALQIYCDFSGYSDIAIGIALLLGFRLMENFDSPYQASSVAEFWRRWHISLSSWLLDYVFKPLQMKFRDLRTLGNAVALVITFVLCGLWHGASWAFLFWGALHGFFMAFALFTKKPKNSLYAKLGIKNSKLLRYFQTFITFNLIAFAWVFFRANSFETALQVFTQIFTFFHASVLLQFVPGYPVVTAMIIFGFILHFIPKSWELRFQEYFSRTPLLGKAIVLAAMIWLVIQVRSAEIQPFIYFQF